VKLIKAGMDSRAVLARFEAERQALALMDHPNIAKVLDAGLTADGRPFFVMELVKGVPITEFCDARRLTPRERLELFVPICQAIQQAHQKGIIHGDIKPSNILVALYDDRPVPKVIDFGVAKAAGQPLTDMTLMTGFGAMVGTPEYMSPEQASFNQLDVDTRSDVYALGVLLYELLTGSPPHPRKELEKAGMLEVLRVIREVEPPRPSARLSTSQTLASLAAVRGTEPARLTRLVRGELDWLVMKALEKDRTRRYETANAFAADVQRYLAGEPVQAVPPSAGYRLKKFVRRHRVGVAAGGLIGLALLGAAIGSVDGVMEGRKQREATALREQAERDRDAANLARGEAEAARAAEQKARGEAEIARDAVARLNYARTIDLARRAWAENQQGRAEELLKSCPPALRGWEWQYVHRLLHPELLTLAGHTDVLAAASFSPDGSRLVTGGADRAARVRVWDARTGAELLAVPGRGSLTAAAAFSPDGTRIVSTGEKGTVQIHDSPTGALLLDAAESFSPDGSRVVTRKPDGSVRVWDAATGKTLLTLKGGEEAIVPISFSWNGSRFAAATDGAGLKVCDGETGRVLAEIKCEFGRGPSPFLAVRISPDGTRIVTLPGDRTARVWDAATGREVFALRGHGSEVNSACFSPDGTRILTAGHDGTARLWDATSGAELQVLRGHVGRVTVASFSPDGSWVVTGGEDGTARA